MKRRTSILQAAAAAGLAAAAVLAWAQLPSQPVQVDLARLEAIEDISEGLANDLLELSIAVRGRDRWDNP